MSVVPAGWPVAEAVFALIALVSVASAIAVVTRRNPIAAVAWLVVHFVATACAYVLLASQFIAALQVLVYAGAIMVLFLFVVMLLAVDKQPEPGSASGAGRKVLVAALGLVLLTLIAKVAATGVPARGAASGTPAAAASALPEGGDAPAAPPEDSVASLADALFSRHLVAFELSSVVLIAAMAGVLVYTTRRGPRGPAPEIR